MKFWAFVVVADVVELWARPRKIVSSNPTLAKFAFFSPWINFYYWHWYELMKCIRKLLRTLIIYFSKVALVLNWHHSPVLNLFDDVRREKVTMLYENIPQFGFLFHLVWKKRQPFPPGHTPLKVPNIEFDFNVSVDREHWRTVTSKSNSRPYNSVQMSIPC